MRRRRARVHARTGRPLRALGAGVALRSLRPLGSGVALRSFRAGRTRRAGATAARGGEEGKRGEQESAAHGHGWGSSGRGIRSIDARTGASQRGRCTRPAPDIELEEAALLRRRSGRGRPGAAHKSTT
ncbi:hypothetical protein A7982_13974 [Minicystis rosea]|nr:hypothetical protein A7982_13974 [Minicystis rosea]